jgi:hypothetical protein
VIFQAATFQKMHDSMDAARGRAITIMVNTGSGFSEYESRAVFGSLDERDLSAGTTIRQSDIKLIISSTHWPAGVREMLEIKDRIRIDGVEYAVIKCDPYSRAMGDTRIATEVMVRG